MPANPDAEILKENGEQAYRAGDYLAAARLFLEAGQAYASNGDVLASNEMRNNGSVAFLQAGEAKQAWDAVEGTDAVFAVHSDAYREAMALGNQAAALENLGRTKEAIQLYRKSARLLKGSPHAEQRAAALRSLAVLEIRSGDRLQALASMHAALSLSRKLTLKERALKKLLDIPMRMLAK